MERCPKCGAEWNRRSGNVEVWDCDTSRVCLEFSKCDIVESITCLRRQLSAATAEVERLRAENSGLRERVEKAEKVVFRLVAWSKKWPRNLVHGGGGEAECNAELYAIEDDAKSAANPTDR